jgi:hypothetical protein
MKSGCILTLAVVFRSMASKKRNTAFKFKIGGGQASD